MACRASLAGARSRVRGKSRFAALAAALGPTRAQIGSICDASFRDSLTRSQLAFQNACKLDLGDMIDVRVVCAG